MLTKIKNIFFSGKRKFITFGVLFLLVLLFSRKPKVVVETANVVRENIVESVSASGEIDADQKADLTFQGSGRLIWACDQEIS